MDKVHPLALSMVIQSLDVKKDSFCQLEDEEKLFVLRYYILVLLEF